MKFCQSYGMPMGNTSDLYGTNEDGSKNEDYCIYCYEDGIFTSDASMEEMIEFCIQPTMASVEGFTKAGIREMMVEYLKRCKNQS